MKNSIKLMCCGFTVLAGVAVTATLLAAQGQPPAANDDIRAYVEMLRSDFNTAKIGTINEVMGMTAREAERFWPIYRNYEKDLAAVGDRKLDLIREFATFHANGTLDDRRAKDLAERWLKNYQDRLDLWKRYHKQVGKSVSPLRAAQFLQIEHQMALFVDVSIASEMPAVGSKPPTQ